MLKELYALHGYIEIPAFAGMTISLWYWGEDKGYDRLDTSPNTHHHAWFSNRHNPDSPIKPPIQRFVMETLY